MAWYDPLLDIPGKAASAVADNAGSLALGTALAKKAMKECRVHSQTRVSYLLRV